MSPSLGYLIDHPLARASLSNPYRWDAELLMAGVPLQVAPDHFLDEGLPDAPLDQDGVGACVAFSGETILNPVEFHDEGPLLFTSGVWTGGPDSTGAFRAYYDLKHGFGTFPGDGIPNDEGSYPEALWKLAKAEGLPDKAGKRHKISAYYSHTFASRADFEFLQQVILAYGPVNFGIGWPLNWMASPPGPLYRMPSPDSPYGGHAIACVGWDVEPDGDWLVMVQTWGRWGGPKGIYRIRADWLYKAPLGPQILWKVVDIKDAPTPPKPEPDMDLPVTDMAEKLVDCAIGTQFFHADGTPWVKLSSGGTGIASPCAVSAAQRVVYVKTGGVLYQMLVNTADCQRMRAPNAHRITIPAPEVDGTPVWPSKSFDV